MHTPLQLPSQSALQDPSQLKFPGFAVQVPMQLPVQLPVHDTEGGVAMQLPWQLASSWPVQATCTEGAVQSAMHCADASSVQFSVPLPAKIAAPLQAVFKSGQFVPALALPAKKNPEAATATAKSEDQRCMENLPEIRIVLDETSGVDISFKRRRAP